MPNSCCALGCKNRRYHNFAKSFYRIPSKPYLRAKWLAAIKRENWSEKSINAARICGDHFISG